MNAKKILIPIFVLLVVILAAIIAFQQPETILPAVNALLMVAIGLCVGIFLAQRYSLPWGIFGAGLLTFIGSQVLHIPFNIYLLNPFLAKYFPQPQLGSPQLALWGLFLGLSAGLFEETARYLTLRFWRKDVTTWKRSLMFGAGHGGIEAILIGIITFIAFFQLTAYRQMDLTALAETLDSTQFAALQNSLDTFWNLEWYQHLWGALERLSVLPVHLSATVLVYRSLQEKNALWYLAAVGWHTAVDFFAVFGAQTWGIPLTELALFIFGLLSVGIIFLLREKDPAPPNLALENQAPLPPPDAVPAPDGLAQDNSITLESLEESKYE